MCVCESMCFCACLCTRLFVYVCACLHVNLCWCVWVCGWVCVLCAWVYQSVDGCVNVYMLVCVYIFLCGVPCSDNSSVTTGGLICFQCIELRDRILPLMGLVRQGQIQGLGKDYVLMKYHIIIKWVQTPFHWFLHPHFVFSKSPPYFLTLCYTSSTAIELMQFCVLVCWIKQVTWLILVTVTSNLSRFLQWVPYRI